MLRVNISCDLHHRLESPHARRLGNQDSSSSKSNTPTKTAGAWLQHTIELDRFTHLVSY